MVKKIDHIGIAVVNLEEAVKLYADALGLEATEVIEVKERGLRIAFIPLGDSEIELLSPWGQESEISRFIEKKGEGIHHICLQVDDVEATIQRARENGLQVVEHRPRRGARGNLTAFIHPKSTKGTLIEVCD